MALIRHGETMTRLLSELWTGIGAWRTLDTGLWVASRLRAGTHFWDAESSVARIFDEAVYAAIRGEDPWPPPSD